MAPPLTPDPETAERLLREELANGDYRLGVNPLTLLQEWLQNLLASLFRGRGTSAWQETAVVAVVLAVAIIALFLLVRRFWPRAARSGTPADPPAAEARRSAADHRRDADAAAEAGESDRAVLETVRALIAGSAERGLLDLHDGMTIREAAEQLGAVFPQETDLGFAADRFALARYAVHHPDGPQQLCSAADLARVSELEHRLREAAPDLAAV